MIPVRRPEPIRRSATVVPDIPLLVRRLRDARGLTQEQLAREMGVTFSTINAWENGKHRPIPALVNRLLDIASAAGVEATAERRTPAPQSGRRGRSPGK